MPDLDLDAFMRDWRSSRHRDGAKIVQAEYDLVMSAINGTYKPTVHLGNEGDEPDWLFVARHLIGTREIPGPQHNPWIVKGWKRLGAGWFTDDETPWCGLMTAHCMDAVGLTYPKMFPRAKSWAKWGKPCAKTVGAIAVFGRKGGGHVGFLVGESASNFYVLGGNQSNMVNIMPIAKSRLIATRWPSSRAVDVVPLPQMSGGAISRNEA